MSNKALGGLLLVAIGVGIVWLWYRGYFGTVIANATGGLAGTGAKVPFKFGSTPSASPPSAGRNPTHI